MRTKIYFLRDENKFVRYVGKTCRPLEVRLRGHLQEALKVKRNHRCIGIRAMLHRGFSPTIDLITEVKGNGCKAEIAYIAWLRSKGITLWNGTDGGDGCKATPEIRIKMKRSAKKRAARGISLLTRLRMSISGKGRVVTEEVRKRISDKQKGIKRKPHTIEWKRLISQLSKGRPWSEKRRKAQASIVFPKRGSPSMEIRKKVADAHRGLKYQHSEEYKRKHEAADRTFTVSIKDGISRVEQEDR